MSSDGVLSGFWSRYKTVLSREFRSLTNAERDILTFMLSKSQAGRFGEKQREIADRLDISLTTVKAAYKRLKDLRIIAMQGHSVFINPEYFHDQAAFPETYKPMKQQFDDAMEASDKKSAVKAELKKLDEMPWSGAEMNAFSNKEHDDD